jgi:hypothetical protein
VRLTKEPGIERKLSQEEIADKLTKWTNKYPNETSVTQQSVGQTWWYRYNTLFKLKILVKLEEKIPLFMAVDNDPTFQCLM